MKQPHNIKFKHHVNLKHKTCAAISKINSRKSRLLKRCRLPSSDGTSPLILLLPACRRRRRYYSLNFSYNSQYKQLLIIIMHLLNVKD